MNERCFIKRNRRVLTVPILDSLKNIMYIFGIFLAEFSQRVPEHSPEMLVGTMIILISSIVSVSIEMHDFVESREEAVS